MRNISKNIRDLRIRSGLTQDDLAGKLFVTRQTVSNYENGKSRPDIDMLMRLAEVLDTDMNTILYGPQPRDRVPLIRLAAGAIISLALGILWLVSRKGRFAEYANFEIGIMVWLYSIIPPIFFAILGWTLVQGTAILTRAKQPSFTAGKLVIISILLGWLLLLVNLAAGWFSLPRFLYLLLLYSLKSPWLFLFPGIGIWLCGFPRQKA